jgi:hypothetical protein
MPSPFLGEVPLPPGVTGVKPMNSSRLPEAKPPYISFRLVSIDTDSYPSGPPSLSLPRRDRVGQRPALEIVRGRCRYGAGLRRCRLGSRIPREPGFDDRIGVRDFTPHCPAGGPRDDPRNQRYGSPARFSSSRTTSGWLAAATSRPSRSPWSSRTSAMREGRRRNYKPREESDEELHHYLRLDSRPRSSVTPDIAVRGS